MAEVRTLGPALAQVVEELELEQPVVVTLSELAEILRRRQVRTGAVEVARRLRERGWLLETSQRGVFEFAPGAHAGPHGHGDPFVDLRAYLAATEARGLDDQGDRGVAACLHTAVWLRGYADRAPNKHEIALRPGVRAPKALTSAFRVVPFDSRLHPELVDGIPVHRPATVLAHLISRPSHVRSWPVFVEALPELVAATTVDDLAAEMHSRPASTRARLGYLLEGQQVDHLALADLGLIRPRGTIWFGPRDGHVHYDAQWNIADTVLHPRTRERGTD